MINERLKEVGCICNGSGEGRYDGSICPCCKGSGTAYEDAEFVICDKCGEEISEVKWKIGKSISFDGCECKVCGKHFHEDCFPQNSGTCADCLEKLDQRICDNCGEQDRSEFPEPSELTPPDICLHCIDKYLNKEDEQ